MCSDPAMPEPAEPRSIRVLIADDHDIVRVGLSRLLAGVEATRRIARAAGAPSVVVLTSFSDRERITQAIDSGAVGYLLKESDGADVIAGVRAAARGASPIDPRVALTVVRERRSGTMADGLTDREREVLALVGAGVPNKQIAQRLGISAKTVKSHLSHIFRRIGVGDRFQAAMWARRHGLVDERDEPRRGS